MPLSITDAQYEGALIRAYVPESCLIGFDAALSLAHERDAEAAMELEESINGKRMLDITKYMIEMYKKSTWVIKPVICNDGSKVSVQGSQYHYCTPREDQCNYYTEVELGFPSFADDELLPYAEIKEEPCNTVYGYVPIDLVQKVIDKHGGINWSAYD